MNKEGLLYIFDANKFLMIYLLLIGIILEIVYLGQQYMKKFRYYKIMESKLEMLDQKNMISEMLERPDFFEGELLYDIISVCNKSMNEEMRQINYYLEQALYYARSNSVEKDYIVKELNLKDIV